MSADVLPELLDEQDTATWRTLMTDYRERLQVHGCQQAVAGFAKLGISEEPEPMSVVDQRLYDLSGWRMEAVGGLLDGPHFYELLRDRRFPTAPTMRRPDEVQFSELPDLFHDVAGHLPVLVDPVWGDFLSAFGALALRHVDSEPVSRGLARFYWFTSETGLVDDGGELKILGAAVLTSAAESQKALAPETVRTPLDLAEIFETDYNIFDLQQKYFVAESYDALPGILDDLAAAASVYRSAHE